MSYPSVFQTTMCDGQTILMTKRSWRSYFRRLIWTIPGFVIAYFARDIQPVLAFILLASSVFGLALIAYHRSLQRYEIAPGPIVRQHVGFVSRAARRIPVSGQMTVEYAQSAWGRIFNFGNVKIYSDMNASLDWVGVVSPRKVVAYIEDIRLSPSSFSI